MLADQLRKFVSNYSNEYSLIYKGVIVLPIAVVGIAGVSLASSGATAEGVPVTYRHVLAAEVRPDAGSSEWLTGVVQSSRPIEAAATVGGRVVRVLVNLGDYVAAGQPIAIIDTKAAELRSSQAAAEVDRAQALAAERAKAAQRAGGMMESGAIAAAERDAAVAEAASARAAVAAARAAHHATLYEARQGVIRAQASGTVAERLAEVGAVVTPGQKLFSIEGAGERVVFAAVPQSLSGRLRNGQPVTYVSDTHSGTGSISGISPRVADGGVVPIRIRLTSGSPLVGSVVQVSVATATTDGSVIMRVPASALMLDQRKQPFVYRLGVERRAERIAVRVAGFTGSDVRIIGKLQIGQKIIAAGGAFVAPGQIVAIARPGA